MKARFCSQCRHALVTRRVAGRLREMCEHCGTIFYRNPLPVAAAVLLNERREVLLVRRRKEPYQGLWCLPMGFAELEETIAQACLRELKEEAGIRGRILRLLTAESDRVEPYGDLLIVTFEVERMGGRERAGDDAEAVAYFAPPALPAMAFAANEKAVRTACRAHGEEWAIADSFQQVREDAHQSMLSDALVAFISQHAGTIARAWLREVRTHVTTPSYATADQRRLLRRAEGALSQFSRWLSGREDSLEIRRFYLELGRERRAMGFGLPEVLSSLTLLRRQILTYAMSRGVWHGAIDAYRVLELDHRIMLFFDRAMFHVARGHREK